VQHDHTPQYRRQRKSDGRDLAFVLLDGQRRYLGRYETPESHAEYARLIAEWKAGGRRLPVDPADITIVELAERFMEHAGVYYVKAGQPTNEVTCLRAAIKPVTDLYGRTLAADFTPRCLKTVRTRMIELGWCRNHINKQVCRVRMMFKWGVDEGLVAHSTYGALSIVAGLKRGRSAARESEPVRPVPQEHVDALQAHVGRQVWALIQLQLLTAARPGELLPMRPMDMDTRGPVWTYTPATHKTEHHGHGRTIYLGPQAQQIVTAFLAGRGTDKPLFSPAEADAEHRDQLHRQRKTPLHHGNSPGTNVKARPECKPGEAYDVGTYRRAIQRACVRANVPSWHPHQLRHNAATRLRRDFGIDLAQTILGHRLGSAITELYAEANVTKAIEVMQRVG